MTQRRKKNKRAAAVCLCASLVLLTAATGGMAVAASRGGFIDLPVLSALAQPGQEERPDASRAPSETPPDADMTPDEGAPAPGEEPAPPPEPARIRRPDEMRAVMLTPGVDYLTGESAAQSKERIDDAVAAAVDLTMNTMIVETALPDGGVVYPSALLPNARLEPGFDPVAHAVESARAAGLYVYVVCYATDRLPDGQSGPAALGGRVDAALLDAVAADMSNVAASYRPDGVLLDGYYNVADPSSYQTYLRSGAAIGFDAYMRAIPEELVTLAREKIKAAAPSVQLGLLSEAQWASQSEVEGGSATSAAFSALTDGNADALRYAKQGLVDFVAVRAYGSLDDGVIPYQQVVSWWAEETVKAGVPLYVVHAADRAVTDAVGWSEYDQLARQVITGREQPGYEGSIFNSLSRLLENPKDMAVKLVGYYEGSVKPEHIMTDLELTQPAKTVFTSFDPTVIFAGNTDPNTDATINGTPVVTDENGYFTLEMDLAEGENVFQIVHKGKTVTYKITRVVEVVREVTPTGVITADGGTKLTIGAVAYADAKVYAVINGKTVPMTLVEDEADDTLRDTAYRRFAGTFTLPEATTTVQDLGSIVVFGEWQEFKKNKTGGSVKVNARALPSDGRPVVVTSEWAETFPSNTLSHYSDPSYFPLPKGALDYAVGDEIKYTATDDGKTKTYSFYRLQSGLRVLTGDIAAAPVSAAPVGNRVSGCTVTSDSRHTRVILSTQQKVAYTARFSSDAVTVQFHYTSGMPEGMSLNKNPLFSSVSFTDDTMTLKLREQGVFMGYAAYFDSDGNLVLRFNNPPVVSGNDLTGVKIVVDPGHHVSDPGAPGYLASHPERVINYQVAAKLASVLRSRGASVVMYDTQNYAFSLEQRVQMANAADPHLFVSIHSNSSAYSRSADGSEAYYFSPYSYALSQYAAGNTASALNTNNRGGKFGRYYVTRSMQFPSILVEMGFMSNQTEYSKLVNDEYQSRVASGLAGSISSYLKLMGNNAGLTGTQSSGAAPSANAGRDDGPPDTAGDQAQAGGGTLMLSDREIYLLVGEELTLSAWDNDDEDCEIEWSALGDGEAVHLQQLGTDSLDVTGVRPGEITVTARVKGDPSRSASCVIVVEE